MDRAPPARRARWTNGRAVTHAIFVPGEFEEASASYSPELAPLIAAQSRFLWLLTARTGKE